MLIDHVSENTLYLDLLPNMETSEFLASFKHLIARQRKLLTTDQLAQLVEDREAETVRDAVGSNSSRSNTQGL